MWVYIYTSIDTSICFCMQTRSDEAFPHWYAKSIYTAPGVILLYLFYTIYSAKNGPSTLSCTSFECNLDTVLFNGDLGEKHNTQ